MKRNDSIIPKKYDLARFKGKLTERTFYERFYTLRFTNWENLFKSCQVAAEGMMKINF